VGQNDFNHGILDETAHRPWPKPRGPWIMSQTWNDLLFAHWPIEVDVLRPRVPIGVELDLFDGHAWLGIVPFHMTNVAPRFTPALPWLSAFPELNVRTYVRVGHKPGVYFFSLDASNAVAVHTARAVFHLPYFTAEMHVDVSGGRVRYRSQRRGDSKSVFEAEYRPTGPASAPRIGSREEFLTERYCLYAADSSGRLHRLEIHHPPWPLQPADGIITRNTMADAAGIRLPDAIPLFHFSKRQDMVAWPMHRI
jgi:uncharacterized protein